MTISAESAGSKEEKTVEARNLGIYCRVQPALFVPLLGEFEADLHDQQPKQTV